MTQTRHTPELDEFLKAAYEKLTGEFQSIRELGDVDEMVSFDGLVSLGLAERTTENGKNSGGFYSKTLYRRAA